MGEGDEGTSPYRFTFVIFILSIVCLAANLPSLIQPQASPEGESIPLPAELQPLTDHVLLLVLDGVPNVAFDDEDMMPFMAPSKKMELGQGPNLATNLNRRLCERRCPLVDTLLPSMR